MTIPIAVLVFWVLGVWLLGVTAGAALVMPRVRRAQRAQRRAMAALDASVFSRRVAEQQALDREAKLPSVVVEFAPAAPAIPERIQRSIDLYVTERLAPGSGVQSILAGDLFGAIDRADDEVRAALPAIVTYIRCKTPQGCHGSASAVVRWLAGRPS